MAAHWQNQLETFFHLNDRNVVTGLLGQIEEKTKVKKLYLILAVTVILAIAMLKGIGELLCNILVFPYPAYKSFQAMDQERADERKLWITYWVVCSLLHIVDYFSHRIMKVFPIYWVAKCIFLFWCFWPLPRNGSAYIYVNIIRPYFTKENPRIDSALNSLKKGMSYGDDNISTGSASMSSKKHKK